MVGNVTNLAEKRNPFIQATSGASPIDLDEKSKELLVEFNANLAEINRRDLPYQQKLDLIIEMQTKTCPLIFQQLLSPAPNVDISVIASRTSILLKDISQLIIKKRKTEVAEDINVSSPKFQLIFGWFLELFSRTLHENKVNEVEVSNIFSSLANNLVGWEDRIQKGLKGLSNKALTRAKNPFIEDFKEKLKVAKD